MGNPQQRRLPAPLIVVLGCVLATVALTLLFAMVPELADGAGSSLLWLAG